MYPSLSNKVYNYIIDAQYECICPCVFVENMAVMCDLRTTGLMEGLNSDFNVLSTAHRNDVAWSAWISDTFQVKIFFSNEKSKLKFFSPCFEAWWWHFRSSISGMLSVLPYVHHVMQWWLLSAGEQSELSSVPLPPCISTTWPQNCIMWPL